MHWRNGIGRIAGLIAASVAVVSLRPQTAWAGMPPAYVLTDLARARVEAISFFLFILFLSAAIVQRLWNHLRSSFTRLPRLSFLKAVSLVALWGLLFMIVLAMISGGRELTTPGAWERHGASYRLVPPTTAPASQPIGAEGDYAK
jgi:hypothetical protein